MAVEVALSAHYGCEAIVKLMYIGGMHCNVLRSCAI